MFAFFNNYVFILISLTIHIIGALYYLKDSNLDVRHESKIEFNILSTSIFDIKNKRVSSVTNEITSTPARTSPKNTNSSITTASPTFFENHVGEEDWPPPKHYRSTNELHTRAVPIADWQIDTSQAPNDIFFVLVFTVWISATGSIDLIEYPNSDDESPWLSAVTANLGKTVMQPATFDGQPVPSTMTVEVSVEPVH